MAMVWFAFGLAAAVLLIPLLWRTRIDPVFRIWPTPSPGTWQSRMFWTLFRTLNVTAFATAIADQGAFFDLPDGVRLTGLLALGLSGTLYLSACIALGRNNTYCSRDGLVTHGIYRWTRNPQYATVIPVFASLAIAADSGMTYILCLALTCVYVLMALVEEPWLEAAYGLSYLQYCRRVPRFFNWHRAWVLLQTGLRHVQRQLWPRLLDHTGNALVSTLNGRKRM
jgi:protein-S-isoprenylcysteine O-methyltransferase Ste14